MVLRAKGAHPTLFVPRPFARFAHALRGCFIGAAALFVMNIGEGQGITAGKVGLGNFDGEGRK